ncbi:LysR family transcriptional regulator [Polaribacter glomeratus]|uniref:LysR family transcriptional regulator n=1 Tax=Polaribacter glomeratus TaxID=102 RepID=A0A2S7WGB1_9FLAO|nr:LysR family transcriptional regulator [Polaribacter glomeratus]PQJ76640.1 LysR family transcriptional regulator [Polaribacter glomeratus]TXD67522.1 LysR family transcriptional regulator [Polaribacter glomeratus]
MNFTLHQLKVFTTIVENKSITKAANELNMTQPAASIQLKNFQDQFDIPLSEIIGRQFYVTDFGREIFVIAEEILNKTETIQYKTEAFRGLLSGKLKISVVSTGNYVMPYFLSGFLKKYPKVELVLDVSNKTTVIKDLEQNLVDFSLVTVSPSHLEIEELPLMDNHLVLVASKENKIISEKGTSIFKTIPLIYREEGSGTRHTMQQFFKQEKIAPKIKLELTSNEAIKQAVVANIGVSIVSLLSIKNELLQNELKIIPAKGLPLKSVWKLIYLKKKTLSPVAKAFLAYVASEKETVYKNYFSWIDNTEFN